MCLQRNGLAVSQQSFGTPLVGKKNMNKSTLPVATSRSVTICLKKLKMSTSHCLSQKSKQLKRRNNSCSMPRKHVLLFWFSLEAVSMSMSDNKLLSYFVSVKEYMITTNCQRRALYTYN